MDADIQARFYSTGRVPKGYAATILTPITIQHERLVQSTVVVTGPIVREGRSVKKEKFPVDRWELHPIDRVPSVRVKPNGETEVYIYDLTRR